MARYIFLMPPVVLGKRHL